MSIVPIILGRRNFKTKGEIIEFVKNSKNYNPKKEFLDDSEALLIFQTSNQQTWLVSTKERLYCILDDIRKDKPNINWSVPKERLTTEDKVNVEIKIRDKSERTGLLDIGPNHRNWFFSKDLFKGVDINNMIRGLISKTMLLKKEEG